MSLQDEIKELQQRKWELSKLQNRLKLKEEAFEEEILPLKREIHDATYQIAKLSDKRISIPLKNLLAELSKITGISLEQMDVQVSTDLLVPGAHLRDELVSRVETLKKEEGLKCHIKWQISGDKTAEDTKKMPFFYKITSPLNLMEIQEDGKYLFEHCLVECSHDRSNNTFHTTLLIDIDVENILCSVSLSDVVGDDQFSFYPVRTFQQVIANCQQEKGFQKVQLPSNK